jgi:multidrug efflux pump subunit AcrB
MGKILRVIPIVVISVLMVSLVEALLILPAHLSGGSDEKLNIFAWATAIHSWAKQKLRKFTNSGHSQPALEPSECQNVISQAKRVYQIPTIILAIFVISIGWILCSYRRTGSFIFATIDKLQAGTESRLESFINGPFAAFVKRAVKFRYITLATGLAIFLITVGWIVGGYIKIVFFDPVEADNMVATISMPQGTPVSQTQQVADKIEQAVEQVRREFDTSREGKPSVVKHIATTIGDQPASRGGGPVRGLAGVAASNLAEVNVELLSGEERGVSSVELKNRWRDIVGEIPGVSSLTFFSEILSTGEAINVELSHENFDTLLTAVTELKSTLRAYSGVSDITDSFEEGKAELKLALKDTGRTLGLTLSDLARQVRQAFYGEEAQRIQRGRDDIRVMVRYPEQQRKSLADVENMRIRLSDGTEIPFKQIAEVQYGRGYATIRRAERRRVVNVTADVEETVANAKEINTELSSRVLPALMQQYAGLQFRFAGEERERNEAFSSLLVTFPLALLAIYALLAVQFRSYFQPLIVMSAIPFGIVGAVIGHVLMGFVFMTKFNLGILSMFGIVALSGVVVNDSLIMIDLINRERAGGIRLDRVIRDCATRRFRPIMLTTLTTFFGLVPMMLERSLQARFLIPMAISLAFGVMFATLITLFLVPSLYMILEDIKSRFCSVSDLESDS